MSRKFSEFQRSEGRIIVTSESFAIAAKESLNSKIKYMPIEQKDSIIQYLPIEQKIFRVPVE